jgi:3-oxoacyl-[acyl-carrier protein] reductase
MKLEGKVAIITGGGSGLGREVALAYAQEGASLVLTSNAGQQIEQVAQECHVLGVPALPVYADVSAPDDVAAMVERSLEEFNRIDILVCSAAVNEAVLRDEPRTRLLDLDPEHWKRIIDVNVNGVFLCNQAVAPAMIAKGGGSIMNLSSGLVRFPATGIGAYTTSKWAVEGFTKVLALELEAANVRVNCIQPGGTVDTAFVGTKVSAEERATFHRPEVIRECAVWLGSDESRLITGRSIVAADWNRERNLELCSCDRCTHRSARFAVEWRGVTAL